MNRRQPNISQERLTHDLRIAPIRLPCYKKVFVSFDKLLTLDLGVPFGLAPGTLRLPPLSLGVILPCRPFLIESMVPMSLKALKVPLLLISLRSIRSAFHPSSSRSRRKAFSFSSRSSRSARLAWSVFADSDDCSSSIVCKRLEIRSRALAMSSLSWLLALSRRSI